MKFNIRILYLYLFSFIGLIVTVIGLVRLVDLGLKVIVFQGADQYMISTPMSVPAEPGGKIAVTDPEIQLNWEKEQKKELIRQRQRDFSGAIAMVIVGVPLYLYHWNKIKKEKS